MPLPRLIVAIVCLGLWACGPGGEPGGKGGPKGKGQGGADAGAPAPVEVRPAEVGPVRDGLEATGTVEAERTAILRARVGGTLPHFTLDEGSPVQADKPLLRVLRPEFGTVLSKARAQHEKARRDAQALATLSKDGLVPTQELEEARFAARQAKLEVERLQDEAGLERVSSPIDGVITVRRVQPGEAVSPGAELFQVADLGALWVHLRLPERHLPKLKVGLPVQVEADGLGEALTGRVARIAPVVDPASGTAKVTVDLSDGLAPGGGRLRPGMYVRCRIIVDTRPQAVKVPRRALVQADDRTAVFVVVDGKARKRAVELGYADGDRVQVVTGVQAGEPVIVFGQRGLDDGAAVKPVAPPGEAKQVGEAVRVAPAEGAGAKARGPDAGSDGGTP
ncbi:MAG: efflux RND transporter periplasmic adaptor subunit [Myxococcales bacterium]|nr:efflux RND transporter periplasmic adaptor subunit [Myxococcales bacterium]